MRCAIIGGTGHYGYLLEALRRRGGRDSLCAVAPGGQEEDISGLMRAAEGLACPPKPYADWRAMLDAEKPEFVAVAPWFCMTAPITLDLMQRGIPAFAEKPLATDWTQWHALVEAMTKWPEAKVSAMFGIRAHPAFAAAKEAVSSLGSIRMAHGQKSYKLGTRGPVYQQRARYGGIMPWVGIHAMDWIYWTTGKRFLTAHGAHSQRANGGNGELESNAAALFIMEDACFATVQADFLRPQAAPRHDDDQLRLTGTQGTLFVRNGRAYLEPADGPLRELPMEGEGSLCAAFMTELEGGPSCGLTMTDAMHVTAAALAVRDAADSGAPCSVPCL